MTDAKEVEIVFKSPYPAILEQRRKLGLLTTVAEAKEALVKEITGAPSASAVRLIYGGRVLFDRDTLSTVLANRDLATQHTIHFVFSQQQQQPAARFEQPPPPVAAEDDQNPAFLQAAAQDAAHEREHREGEGGLRAGLLFRLAFFWYVLCRDTMGVRSVICSVALLMVYLHQVGVLGWLRRLVAALWQLLRLQFRLQQPQQQQPQQPGNQVPLWNRLQRVAHTMLAPFFLSLSPSWEIPAAIQQAPQQPPPAAPL